MGPDYRYKDILNPAESPRKDTRTGSEIALEVIGRLGLHQDARAGHSPE